MSDVTIADAGPAPAQAPTEVEINQNPVSAPNPIGSQAPEKSDADHRREAIQKAFDKASNPQRAREQARDRPQPKAADAKVGHNQPPEATPKDKDQPRLDLKKRPDDQPQAQPRDRGRFAPRQADSAANSGQVRPDNQPNQPNQPRPYRQLPPGTPHAEPPGRFSEASKYDWADTPQNVRADIHRMQTEYNKAYLHFKGSHDAFQEVRPYYEMAKQQGTTLTKALTNYVNMEQKLRADPIAGLDVIVNNLGLRTDDGQPIGLRDIAYHILSSTPEQLQQVQMGNQQSAAVQQIGALHQEIAGLKSYLQQMHTAQQFTHTRSAVDQYADSHPRFDELGDLIEQELKLGFNIDQAYQRAELLRPATHAAQTRTASAQTRTPDRSISGSPAVTGSDPAVRRPREASRSPRAAVENAIRRVNGGY